MSTSGGGSKSGTMSLREKDISLYKTRSEAFLKSKNIPVDPATVEKSASADLDPNTSLRVRSNLFNVQVEKKQSIYKYRVRITGIGPDRRRGYEGQERLVDFTEDNASDYYRAERRETCYRLFQAAVDARGWDRQRLSYDRMSSLYSCDKLDDKSLLSKFVFDQVKNDDPESIESARFRDCTRFDIEFQFVSTVQNKMLPQDMVGRLDEQELSLIAFVNVASSQVLLMNPQDFVLMPGGTAYLMDPAAHGFDPQFAANQQRGGTYIAAGLRKSAKLIEANDNVSIGISPKLSLFHQDEVSLEEKIIQLGNRAGEFVKGIYVCPIHLMQRPPADPQRPRGEGEQRVQRYLVLKVQGVSTQNSDQMMFVNRDGVNVSVAQYFQQEHGYRLNRPDLPLVEVGQGERRTFYPPEVCVVMRNQMVNTNSAASSDLIAALIRHAAMIPAVLQRRVDDMAAALGLHDTPFMLNAGLRVASSPIELDVPILSSPAILYAQGQPTQFDKRRGNWSTQRTLYKQSAEQVPWVLYAAIRGGAQFSGDDLNKFGQAFFQTAKSRGLYLGDVADSGVIPMANEPDTLPTLGAQLSEAAANGCKFAMVITNMDDKSVHACLKSFEQEFGIITQNVTSKTAIAAAGISGPPKRLTLENIVNKTNVKLGGVNNQIGQLGQSDLIIGFSLNFVPGGTVVHLPEEELPADEQSSNKDQKSYKDPHDFPVTVLGYSANDSRDFGSFVGDFVYHRAMRQGDLSAFERAMEKICERCIASRQGTMPKRVIVYRSGCSDGDFQYIRQFEVPLLRNIVQKKLSASLVVMIVNKLHNVIFTQTPIPHSTDQRDKPPAVQNLPFGTIVDRTVTSPLFPEFYLASARALQGTTKLPRYVVLYNNANAGVREIQEVSHGLCYAYQIIPSPVSLPAPLYIADQYAKRGRNLLNVSVTTRPERLNAVQSFNALNLTLTYDQHEHRGKRVNA